MESVALSAFKSSVVSESEISEPWIRIRIINDLEHQHVTCGDLIIASDLP